MNYPLIGVDPAVPDSEATIVTAISQDGRVVEIRRIPDAKSQPPALQGVHWPGCRPRACLCGGDHV